MCRRSIYLIYVVLVLILAASFPADAAIPITVVNPSFELPGTGKRDIDQKGTVPGWTRVDLTTSAGVEEGWTPTDGTYTAFMGKNAVIYNLTDFLMLEGDQYQLIFDARSTWQGNNILAQLYYDDAGTRVPFASTTIENLNENYPSYATFTVDSNVVGPEVNDHKLGIQFTHEYVPGLTPDDNIWAGIDYIDLFLLTPLMRAQNPFPEHQSSYENTSVTLTWVPGPNAPTVDSYQVYFSQNWADVNDGSAAADKGSTNAVSYLIEDLVKNITYYWRIDTVVGADTYRGNIWSFVTKPLTAFNPDPGIDATFVPLDSVLSWNAGSGAVEGHVVFFGDDFDKVNNAAVGTSGPAPFRAYLTNPADTNWAPEEADITLEVSKTYYWRVDEVESTAPQTIHKGDVWQFTTVPVKGLGSITREVWEDIEGTTVADLTGDPNFPDSPSYTEYLTSFETPHMAIVNYGTRVHGWLYVRNSGDYTFWIASGENSQLWLGTHPSTASIIAFVDSEEGREGWTEPRQWDKYPDIQQSAPIHLDGGGTLYYIMVLHKKGWGYDNLAVAWSGPDSNGTLQIIPGTSLIPFEEVTLVGASGPVPADRATGVRRDPTLSWVSGVFAAIHDVYFGTDVNAVSDATASTVGIYKGNQSANTYTPGILDFGATYYWRIDEVNDAHPDKLWKGNVWSFTVGDFLVVDDFEDYNDVSNRIYETWGDYFVNNTGMTVGHLDPPFAEQSVVRGGSQSMYMHYDNDGTVNDGTNYEQAGTLFYSEAERQWTDAQDWTAESVNSLSLWFRGISASVGSFTEGPPIIMTAAGADIWGTADQFHYAYKKLSGAGSITAKVVSISSNTPWAKAGVMIRDSLDPGSAHAMVVVTPGQGISFQRRVTAGAGSEDTTEAGITAPQWVKLSRSGNTITAEYSPDGSNWETLGDQLLPMLSEVYIGLCLTGHNVNETCTAEFSDVAMSGTITGDWQSQDVGIRSNDIEQLYVVLEDNAGNSAVVKHPDPNATTIDSWTEWNISLTDFVGVNLQAVKKMSIGVGDRADTQPGGAGDLYIDDIRLNRP
jgi:regulation of enolase protein 1 (concanavalin A-like superfamily)